MKSRLIASMAWCVLGGCVGYRLAPATNNHRPARGTGGGRGQIAQGRLWHNGWMAMGLQLHPPRTVQRSPFALSHPPRSPVVWLAAVMDEEVDVENGRRVAVESIPHDAVHVHV